VSEPDGAADGADLPDEFVRENREHIRTLVESLVGMAEADDAGRDGVDGAFRAAHSLKANCEIAGLDDAAAVAHAVEDVLAAVRAGTARLDERTAEEAMAAVEAIERVVDEVRKDGTPEIDAAGWTERLRGRLDDPAAGAAPDDDGDGTTTGDPATPAEPDLDALDLDDEARTALEAAGDYDDLDELVAEMDDDAEAFADLEGGGSFDEVEADAGTASDEEGETDAGTASDDDADGAGPPAGEDERPPGDDERPGAAGARASTADDGRVPGIDEADAPGDGGSPVEVPDPDPDVAPWTDRGRGDTRETVEAPEAVAVPGAGRVADAAATIAASSLDADRFGAGAASAEEGEATPEGEGESPSTALGAVRSLAVEERRLTAALDAGPDGLDGRAADALASLRAATGTLTDEAVTDLHRLETLVPDLERAVDRAARHLETPVAFEATVEPGAVERTIVDRLSDPLVHVVRNAVDHDIEGPRERGAAGKPEAGTVTFRARRDGDRLVVAVSDDGRGVDADAVREAAVAAGIEGAADATDDAVLDLLFEAGLSTADADSDLSGRGVGMDVVGRTMTDLDGDVTVDSTPGAGTTVRLSVPVAEVVARVRLVAVGAETYAVPSSAVARVLPVGEATVRNGAVQVTGDEPERDAMGAATAFGSTLEYRPVDLATALSVPDEAASGGGDRGGDGPGGTTALGSASEPAGSPGGEPAFLLVDPADAAVGTGRGEANGTRVALRCDEVLGEHETLVTPLRGVAAPAVDGAVVCDAGQVVPVLDSAAFVSSR
jgi:two-component system chemotaxis sensor kinase CheA